MMRLRAVWAAICLIGLLAVGGAAASSAAAESLCTDTWTGPAEGSWETASNWSAGIPTSSSVACLGSGTTVWTGNAGAESVQDEGHLRITNTLELGELISESSQIANLTIGSSGSLKASGVVDVTHEFVGEGYDGTNSYIYGPEGHPVEQVNSEEHATYLHHDQAGSTRLLTNEKAKSQAPTPMDHTEKPPATPEPR
jgi:hypothetical protein